MDKRKIAVRVMCAFLAALMVLGSATIILSIIAM